MCLSALVRARSLPLRALEVCLLFFRNINVLDMATERLRPLQSLDSLVSLSHVSGGTIILHDLIRVLGFGFRYIILLEEGFCFPRPHSIVSEKRK
jgi:hypothetical protein